MRSLAFLFLLFSFDKGLSQINFPVNEGEYPPKAIETHKTDSKVVNVDSVYDAAFVQEQASFSGGYLSQKDFLSKNIQYPESCTKKNINGNIYVEFIVERDGKLSDIKLKSGIHPLLDEEALRVVKLMPNWLPAKIGGIAVRMKKELMLVFKPRLSQDAMVYDIAYTKVIPPEFIEGALALGAYLKKNIVLPLECKEKKIEGVVYIDFLIDENGNSSLLEVHRGIHSLLDKEALRVLNDIKVWKPATLDGQKVKYHHVVPVSFKMQ